MENKTTEQLPQYNPNLSFLKNFKLAYNQGRLSKISEEIEFIVMEYFDGLCIDEILISKDSEDEQVRKFVERLTSLQSEKDKIEEVFNETSSMTLIKLTGKKR
jgi:hypothetical protein